MKQPPISSLAVISDRNACALLDREGTISWYCPGAFDHEAVFSSLIDQDKGGYWQINFSDSIFLNRAFEKRSSILYTYLQVNSQQVKFIDFMPMNSSFKGICRKISRSPVAFSGELSLRSDYGLQAMDAIQTHAEVIHFPSKNLWLHSSHPITLENDVIHYHVTAGESSWAALTDCEQLTEPDIDEALQLTREAWINIEAHINYEGPFEREVQNSLRALQQMVYEPTGGIIAAPTTGLPEVIGGRRNYDYRFVWMRDAALITSSLVGLQTDGKIERSFMSFVSGAMRKNGQSHVSCFYGIDQTTRKNFKYLSLAGYQDSRPLMTGNTAADQFQLDAEASILLACGAIYAKTDERPEWEIVESIADYICRNWERKDNGIWEEEQVQHYTSSKALAARALEVMAPYQNNQETAERWRYNAGLIRKFINENCLTSYGALAVNAGSEDVDIACALLAPFGFAKADDKYLKATIDAIEKRYSEGNLYRRHLQEFDSSQEGVFLAASCWMAHHYVLAGNLDKANAILTAVQNCANDLGYFSEEYDTKNKIMLGNFPQTFVHSSFICAVNALENAVR